jgi:hypothetical protein
MKTTFTPEQSALIARIWVNGGSIKPYLAELGDRPYSTVVSHAIKTLHLGPRPKSDRGHKEYAWSVIESELQKEPGTVPEITARTGFVFSTVNKRLCLSNAGESGRVHIIDWRKRSNGGKPVPVYAFGPGENAPMPAPFTASEKARLVRDRKRGARNPFLVAAGFVPPKLTAPTGRVFQQPMDIEEWGHSRKEAA